MHFCGYAHVQRAVLELLPGHRDERRQHRRPHSVEQQTTPGKPRHRELAHLLVDRIREQIADQVAGPNLCHVGPVDVVAVEFDGLRAERDAAEVVEQPNDTAHRLRRADRICDDVADAQRPTFLCGAGFRSQPVQQRTRAEITIHADIAIGSSSASSTSMGEQPPSTFTVANSSPRVRPRLMIAIGMPRAAAWRTKRNPENTVNEEPATSSASASSTKAYACATRSFGTLSPK